MARFCCKSINWEITIPDSVTIINSDAFCYNQLVTVTLGQMEIRGAAFRGNNISGDVFIPSQVTMIRDYGFDINQINRVYFYGDRPLLRPAAFRNNSITAVFIENTTGWAWRPIDITSQLDENCGDSNDHGDDEHEEEHHGDDDHADEDHGNDGYCALQ